MKWLAGLLIVALALVGIYYVIFPVYAYRYRLTVSIEVDGKIHSGSSVVEVTWQRGIPLGDVGGYGPRTYGQAPIIDLGDHGVVVATLVNGEDYGPAQDGALGALWVAAEAFDNHSTDKEVPKLPRLRGKRELDPQKIPRLLWLPKPNDPRSAQKLLVQDIPALFGASAHFAGASAEITTDPINVDINKKLPWLQVWPDYNRSPMYLPNNLALSRYMFIGDGS